MSFRLLDKIDVNGENASPLFVKLTKKAGREIQWNFTKFLINKEGQFVRGFGTQKKPEEIEEHINCLLYTSPSPRDLSTSRMPASA